MQGKWWTVGERGGETDRQTRHAGWQVDRDTDRLTDIDTDRQNNRQTYTCMHPHPNTTHTHCFKVKELIPKHTKS